MKDSLKPRVPFWQTSLFKAAVAAMLVFGIMFVYANEFAYLQNTFNATRLVIFSLIVGLIGGWFLGNNFKHTFEDEDERRTIAFGFPLMIALIFPLVTSLANRKLNLNSPNPETVELFKIEPYGTSRVGMPKGTEITIDGYNVYFFREKELERIRFDYPIYEGKKKGEMVQLPVSKGIFGFEYVNPR